MNSLPGEISNIKTSGSLSLVEINVDTIVFKTIIIDTPDTVSYLKLGNKVNVIFKETEVVIGIGLGHKISMQNQIVGELHIIEKGDLLSKLTIATTIGNIFSIITSNSVDHLELKVGDTVTAMIKTNEIMLSAC